ncbi:MAG: hypothetical protein FJ291_08555 [Planctomycetes bacterium]|nr:hypothetical protein [Planctomycetota bacterium]
MHTCTRNHESRLAVIRAHLKDPPRQVWAEPFHEAWVAAEGLDPCRRFATAQAAEMAAARPFVKPGELIIGNNTLKSVVTGLPTPFASGIRLDRAYLDVLRRERPEAAPKLAEIEAYWTRWFAESGYCAPMAMHLTYAWERLLTLGLGALRDYVVYWQKERTQAGSLCHQDTEAGGSIPGGTGVSPVTCWYEALPIVLDGISAYIEAHARAAEEAAEAESGERRDELGRIAAICRHVAHGAPRSFHEAVQLFYLGFQLSGHDSPGPLDRYLWPHLKADPSTSLRAGMESGAITREAAQEIVDCLWLKLEEKTAYGATIGGQLTDGSDASNELSLMCVSAIKRLRILSPRTAFRWFPGVSQQLFDAVVDCIADGATYPAIVNDEAIIPAMVERGIAIEHARDYSFVGCGQTFPHGRGHGNYEDVIVNSAKPLELVLSDGSVSFATWEQFEAAYRRQMDRHITERIEGVNAYRRKLVGHAWDFIRSLLTHSCVERGIDWHAGGADYSEGMVDMVGLTTTTDSLVAIRRAVFEERFISLPELVAALNRNWEGAEDLRQRLLRRMPKFGNEDPEADDYAAAEVGRINGHIKSHKTVFGGPWGMDIIGWSGAVELGAQTGATPDGRRRGEPLADCAGPAQGRNVRGLTATLNSTLRLPHKHAHGPMVLSLRFPRHVVAGGEGRAKLKAAIETYCRQGGQQLQISIASTDDLRAAQRDPDAWRDLMVRVGGFSAYFVQLDRRFQDDMLARSEMEL